MKFCLKALMLLNLLLASGNSIAETDEFDSVKVDNLETSQEDDNFLSGDLTPESQES